YAAADLLLLTSDTEGTPHVLLEAMSSDIPIIATRVGGIPEVMTDGVHGLLVEPQRPAELASAIGRLIANPLAGHVMGLRGRQHVERAYSLDKMRATVEALYEQLAGGAIFFDRPLQAAAG
ncbi:MAG: glycosyltransferase, partial [Polyangia bacterium]